MAALLKNGVDAATVKQWLENGYKLDGVATLLNLGIDVDVVSQLINNKADLKDIAANAKILLDAHIRLDLVNGWLKNGTHLKDAIAIMNLGVDLNQLGTSSQVGDLTGLTGATPNEVLSRIPKDAVIEHWFPEPGRIEEGMEFTWKDANGTWIVRMHEADPQAPIGSNAASGWVMRVMCKGKYMDASGNFYTVKAITNPASSKYDPGNANKTHIPIQAP